MSNRQQKIEYKARRRKNKLLLQAKAFAADGYDTYAQLYDHGYVIGIALEEHGTGRKIGAHIRLDRKCKGRRSWWQVRHQFFRLVAKMKLSRHLAGEVDRMALAHLQSIRQPA